MNKELEDALKKIMGFTTLIVSCEKCRYWREVNKIYGWVSLCTFNNLVYLEVNSMGRCDKFNRNNNLER